MSANSYTDLKQQLVDSPRRWLVTGAAGFIGSNLVEELLGLGQRVVGLDNYATGHAQNIEDVLSRVGEKASAGFTFVEGDIAELETCRAVCRDVDAILHQAALGSVPRSIEDPISSNRANVDGFLNMLVAAKEAGVNRFVYASSSSVYGDEKTLPKQEDKLGAPLSPYASGKYLNELYARNFSDLHGMELVGLRYFNIFGPRQDPAGAYAAVIPRWVQQAFDGKQALINGDGETTRDFCYVANAVQANLLAACVDKAEALGTVYNVAVGEQTSLNQLHELILSFARQADSSVVDLSPEYLDFRAGDVRHSLADISRAQRLLGYQPTHKATDGLKLTVEWFAGRR